MAVERVEDDPFAPEPVDVGSGPGGVAVERKAIRAQRVDGDDDDGRVREHGGVAGGRRPASPEGRAREKGRERRAPHSGRDLNPWWLRANIGRSGMKDLVTAEDVQSVPPGGEISAAPGAIVTPWAREMAASRGVRIVHGPARERRPGGGPRRRPRRLRAQGGDQDPPDAARLPVPRPRHVLHRARGLSRRRAGRGARRPRRRRAAGHPGGRSGDRVGHGRQQGARRARRSLPRTRRPRATPASTTTPTSSPWARSSWTPRACRRSWRPS